MGNLWLKIKIWSKIILAGTLAIFALLFILKNEDKTLSIWFWGSIETTVLRLLFFVVIFSVVATLLVGTALRTVRQVRELRERNKQEKMKREIEEMHASAAKLQTKPENEVKM